jgi:conjugal transfer pilus assembly protein TraL
MHADTYIPRRLDDQWKLGFWDVDVAAPTLFGMFMGFTSGSRMSFAVCAVAGIVTSRWIARVKADKHPAFAMHWLYWHLPMSPITAMRATPPSHIRRMVG